MFRINCIGLPHKRTAKGGKIIANKYRIFSSLLLQITIDYAFNNYPAKTGNLQGESIYYL